VSEFDLKAIAFDLDGTLIDSLPGIEFSIRAAMAQCGVRLKDIDLRSIIGPPIRVILGKLAETADSDLIELEGAFRRSYDSVAPVVYRSCDPPHARPPNVAVPKTRV